MCLNLSFGKIEEQLCKCGNIQNHGDVDDSHVKVLEEFIKPRVWQLVQKTLKIRIKLPLLNYFYFWNVHGRLKISELHQAMEWAPYG